MSTIKLEGEINKDTLKMAWAELQAKIRKIKNGGGKERLKKLEEKREAFCTSAYRCIGR